MKNIYLGCIALLLITITSIEINAQNIAAANISWDADRIFNVTIGQWIEQTTSIVTYGNSRIKWKNSNGSMRSCFQVGELIGEWNNVNDDGFAQYENTDGTHNCTVTIRKQGTEAKVPPCHKVQLNPHWKS
jgi:hypothetical protein